MEDGRSFLVEYRIRYKPGGVLPGAFAGLVPGSGQNVRAVVPLKDHPDPRRLDLRASLRDPLHRLWVRDFAQNTATRVIVLADFSASMAYRGYQHRHVQLRDIATALARSAFRNGDAFGFYAANEHTCQDLCLPPRVNRSAADWLERRLRATTPTGTSARGLLDVCMRLPRRHALVFVISDFNWPDREISALLKSLAQPEVVPMVLQDPAEFAELPSRGFASLLDLERGTRRFVWLRPRLVERIRQAGRARREHLDSIFGRAGCAPFYLDGRFDPRKLTNHFLRSVAP